MEKELVAPDFWEEHCIECGAPACYQTCEKFGRAPGGACRRFAKGMERTSNGFAITFLPWGKLELYWQGRMVKPATRKILERGYGWLAGIVRLVLGENGVRGICRRITCRIGIGGRMPSKWVINCRCEADEELMVSVANLNAEEFLVQRLNLKAGDNECAIDLPRVPPKSFFRLASIAGTRGRIEFSQCRLVCEAHPRYVKCVAWDLDNTLWDGVLANDGLEGVRLRSEVVETIKALDSRGILNTICSKNDRGLALKVLDKFGIKDYFVFPAINWNPKSENLKQLAKDINIGLDAFALVDDSEHERGEVADNLKVVRVYRETDAETLPKLEEFCPPVSAESASRRQSYLAEMERRHDEDEMVGDHEDFLRKCAIVLECQPVKSPEVVKRCWELVNRTNQLTLAAHRYGEDEFAELLREGEAWAIRCRDKYGDYGVVGFVAAKRQNNGVEIQEFVMSCRVAKKCCEQSVLLALADHFKEQGLPLMTAMVMPTGRNLALIQAFDAMPFECHDQGDKRLYSLDLIMAGWSEAFRNACEII